MPIYKPTELLLFLSQLGIEPKKGLSQNFLIDGNIIRKIVTVSQVQPGDWVLEVGPGPGSLTQALLDAGAKVIAIEKDTVLAESLARLKTDENHLEIFNEDIMTFPVEKILKERLKGDQKAKVIANLPYHLTTPILALFGPHYHLLSSLTVMVQEEVARRMTAKAGTSEYSSLTVFLEFYAKLKYGFTVTRNCFYPVPKVDSAVVVLELRKPPLNPDEAEHFFKMTRTAFGQRRKMMRASLKPLYESDVVTAALEKIGLNPLARPEELTLDSFLHLYKILSQ